ncbi:MAG: hypothetical protein SRB2_02763 [Desulfobacteraceae bacterium Eth-SRB2]|nr:MAG: hypothetical protein SRB2_02763 [Desulfobacteraceae bacterium Eth-SRB2]
MMEYWNDELKKMTFFYLMPVIRNFTITQLSILSLNPRLSEPEAQNPLFQHSTIPIAGLLTCRKFRFNIF